MPCIIHVHIECYVFIKFLSCFTAYYYYLLLFNQYAQTYFRIAVHVQTPERDSHPGFGGVKRNILLYIISHHILAFAHKCLLI